MWQNVVCWTDKSLSKDIDIYAKHGSEEDIAKLNAVSKALKASSMKALRDFQRRQFGTPHTLLGSHYNRIQHRLRKNDSTITQLTQLEQEHAPLRFVEIILLNVMWRFKMKLWS